MPTDRSDVALETLFLPFAEGRLEWPPNGAMFLRARDGWPLHQQPWPELVCEQSFKPEADALSQAGFAVNRTDAARNDQAAYDLVLVLPPRQRDEARALMARAVAMTRQGGRVIACQSNDEGARSAEADLVKLTGDVESMSKHKCRVFWSAPLARIDAPLLEEWRELDAVRPIADGAFVSRPGLFAWDRIDVASALLAEHLPPKLVGQAADLGAGFGYLSAQLLTRCPGITSVDVYEAEQRALDLARINLQSFASRAELQFYWQDVSAGLRTNYDVIVTNPPFHAQRGIDRPDIGRRFIAVAAEALRPGGRLLLVANRHLPYEKVLTDIFDSVRTVVHAHGYKIIEAVRSRASPRKAR